LTFPGWKITGISIPSMENRHSFRLYMVLGVCEKKFKREKCVKVGFCRKIGEDVLFRLENWKKKIFKNPPARYGLFFYPNFDFNTI
jgi:hypothetical protein